MLKKAISLLCVIALLIANLAFIKDSEVQASGSNLTEIDWEDFEGAEYGKTYSTAWDKFTYKDTSVSTLNNTKFTGRIQFSDPSGIRYGGSSEYFGLQLTVISGKLYLWSETFNLGDISLDGNGHHVRTASDFGITSGTFGNEVIELTITMTNVTETTATVGVWVNDIAVNESFTMTSKDANTYKLGTTICIMDANTGGAVTVVAPPAPPTLTEIDWEDFEGAEYGKTYSTAWDKFTYKDTSVSTLNNTKFTGRIQFSDPSGIRYGGSSEYFGLQLTVISGKLYLWSETFNLSDISLDGNGHHVRSASDFEIASGTFGNETIELTITMTNVTETTATVGVWVNDIAVDESFTMTSKDANAYKLGTTICIMDANTGGAVTVVAPSAPPTPPAPTGLTEINWEDFEGAEYGKTYDTKWAKFTYKDTSVTTLNNTKFTGRIQFSDPSGIRYGGSNESFGLQLTVISGKLYLWSETFNLGDISLDGNGHHVRSASDFGIASGTFGNEIIELTITMTNVTETTATVGVWINNIAVDESFTMTSKDASVYKLGTSFCIMDGNTNGAVTVVAPLAPPAPPALTEIDWEDFEGAEYGKTYSTAWAKFTYKDTSASTLNNTKFTGQIQFADPSGIRYGGSSEYFGLQLTVISGKLYLWSETFDLADITLDANGHHVRTASDFGIASGTFGNEKIELTITMTNVTETTATVGVWVNDIAVDESFIMTSKDANTYKLGTTICIMDGNTGGAVTIPEDGTGVNPNPPTLETLPTDFTTLTYADFGLESMAYTAEDGKLAISGAVSGRTNLDKTILHFPEIKFEGNVDLNFQGPSGWEGFKLRANGDLGTMHLTSGYGTMIGWNEIKTDIAGVTLVGDTFDLKFTTEYLDEDTVQLGVWFENILYNNQYYVVDRNQMGQDAFGLYLGIASTSGGGTITLAGVNTEEEKPADTIAPPTDFTVITLDDFGGNVESGLLGTNSPVSGQLNGVGSYNRTIFDVDVDMTTKTPGNNTYIRFGGEADGWVGISVQSNDSGNLHLIDTRSGATVATYTKKVAGVNFYEAPFNLKVSFEYVDSDNDSANDDVKVGVYFNNELYHNDYTYFRDFAMTKWLLAYTDDGKAHPLRLRLPNEKDAEPIAPPTDLKVITFSSFGIDDADFTEIDTTNFLAKGQYRDIVKGATLDGTLFHGKVKFSTIEGCQIRYGGLETPWLGLILGTANEEILALWEAEMNLPEKEIAIHFMEGEAGTTLTGEWLDLKMSTEFVDYDGDGKKDDVKFGIWFNDRMYRNTYYYFVDYAPHMGSYMCVYSQVEESHISIQSVEVDDYIDLAFYGFGDNYRSWFSDETAYIAKGEPLGVTVEYDTVDYELDTSVKKVELKDTGISADGDSSIMPIVAWIAGAVLATGAVFLIVFFGKKRNKGGMI